MNFKPLGNWVVVKRKEAKEGVTGGGIIIPEFADSVANIGTVVAVGEGKRLSPTEIISPRVKVDDEVLFSGGGASETSIDGNLILLMPEDMILGVFGGTR